MPQDNLNQVRVDLNNPTFQADLANLEKDEIRSFQNTFRKLLQMTWQQVYVDRGLNWEKISSLQPPDGIDALYSIRITKSCRAIAFRESDWLRLLLIEPEHDAAYGKK
jgi:hypothetical protein